jgi:hypothetical protein
VNAPAHPKIALPGATHASEEQRAYLQERLMVLSSLMFWSFVTFVGGMALLYSVVPEREPEHNGIIFASAEGGLIVLAVIWRLFLARRKLSMRDLHRIDAFYAIGTGSLFGLGGYLATDFEPAPYMTLLYASLTVLTRAIVVPSSGKRTLVISSLLLAPFFFASVLIAILKPDALPLPRAGIVIAVLLVCVVVVALAANGSETNFAIRKQAREAMQLGQYMLGRKIGAGAMGAVYIAHHVLLRRPTAIKLLLPNLVDAETIDRFEHEVQHMSQLSHPNTVAVFDYGRSPDGMFYYAMEYLDGIDLDKLVVLDGKQPSGRVIEILIQVCGSLQEAHAGNLVHRDIKPANIILCERGNLPDVAKVVDFGLVRHAGAPTTSVEGTPAFMAPEAVTNPAGLTAAADLYSLGCTAFYLLAAQRVFDGASRIAAAVQQVTEMPRDIATVVPDVPPALAGLVMRCLAKDPAVRPTAIELARELRAIPKTGDWDEAKARAWWADFKAKRPEVSIEHDRTATITVDLDKRTKN